MVTLTKTEVNELLGALAGFSAEYEGLAKVVKSWNLTMSNQTETA